MGFFTSIGIVVFVIFLLSLFYYLTVCVFEFFIGRAILRAIDKIEDESDLWEIREKANENFYKIRNLKRG